MDFFVFMSEQWLLVSLLVILLYAFAFSERYRAGTPASVHEVTRLINSEDARVLDVRDKGEFRAGHIVDALNIPHNEVADRVGELASLKDKPLIVVDKIGQHAGAVGRQLKARGFQVRRLQGGMSEWSNQNLPLVKG
ncbi:rhodanese-like domain-containing protein [Microbulbifer yueqingensis]|uniref:Rhodanese-related sulfurtransferase n=1 Tax=Microbulbifer yueqingensis TaxID=658219 RepID=A0A1G9DJP6_9GAMM|nr:rhodanese-like domain-containing protein [Microbulbifer yueqingensis]SDK64112.1 Rhodanese-related sulfurtransferase [Microbulbifer yueqingensis]